MVSVAEFQALMQLLDDESKTVRHAVAKRLLDYEDELPEYLGALDRLPSPATFALMNQLLREAKCETLSDHWHDCLQEPDPLTRLEATLGILADYLDGTSLRSGRLTASLDRLAKDLADEGADESPFFLVQALFHSGRLHGNREDYYAPENSSLTAVIREGRGNPISLVCILILLGKRFHMPIEGCNYPGHFLALILDDMDGPDEPPKIVDCFNGGQFLTLDELLQPNLQKFPELRDALESATPPEVILLRVLRNLHRSFQDRGSEAELRTIELLLERMIAHGGI